jgi:hypothetical protein
VDNLDVVRGAQAQLLEAAEAVRLLVRSLCPLQALQTEPARQRVEALLVGAQEMQRRLLAAQEALAHREAELLAHPDEEDYEP